jgi:negative regulator of sigma E activity
MTPEEVAARRRVLVGALTRCLDASRVKDIVPVDSIRSILESAAGELWREGEFRLEMVWKILCQQPGLSPEEVAPPLLLFKSFESDLEVAVRLPPALSALPPGEQTKLREQVTLSREDFTSELKRLAEAAAAAATAETTQPPKKIEIAQAAQAAVEATQPPKTKRKPITRGQKIAAIAVALVAVAASGVSAFFVLRDPAQENDVADVAPILQLADGKRVEHSLSARIVDTRWDTLGRDEQKRIATQLFDHEKQKGVQVLTLTDGAGRVRVSANNATGQLMLTIH